MDNIITYSPTLSIPNHQEAFRKQLNQQQQVSETSLLNHHPARITHSPFTQSPIPYHRRYYIMLSGNNPPLRYALCFLYHPIVPCHLPDVIDPSFSLPSLLLLTLFFIVPVMGNTYVLVVYSIGAHNNTIVRWLSLAVVSLSVCYYLP